MAGKKINCFVLLCQTLDDVYNNDEDTLDTSLFLENSVEVREDGKDSEFEDMPLTKQTSNNLLYFNRLQF